MKISIRTAALIIVTTLVAACGPSAKEKTLHTTLKTVNATRVAFSTWDEMTQEKIVETSTTREEAEARLEVHRKKQADVVAAFEAAYYAIAIAATDLTDHNVADVITAAALLYRVYQDVIDD